MLSWKGGLAVRWVPGGNPNPVGSLVTLDRVDGEVFREIRSDRSPGKHYVFRRNLNGDIEAMKFNANVLTKTSSLP